MNEMICGLQDEIDDVLADVEPIRKKYAEFNQPRSDVQLRAFVVGQHVTPLRRVHQCLLEISIKDRCLRRAQLDREETIEKIRELSRNDAKTIRSRKRLEIDREEHDEAIIGAVRELRTLIDIYNSFNIEFTHEAWMAEEMEYWQKRITDQARRSINATGTIGVGDQQSLEQLGISPGPLIAEGQACLRQYLKNLQESES